MSARDELARLANGGLRSGVTADDLLKCKLGNDSIGNYIADAILAAGYRKPRTITTAEGLDALAVGSVVLSDMGNVYVKDVDLDDPCAIWWVTAGAVSEFQSNRILLPATVLYEPTA